MLFKAAEPKYKISTGLTIPFIFGAYEKLGQPFNDINHLIETIIEARTGQFPVLQRCDVIGRHIIMLEDKSVCNRSSYNYSKEYSLENSAGEKVLFIDRNSWSLGRTIERVCSNLNAEYADPILGKRFSWDNKSKKWRKFEDGEIGLIESVLRTNN